MIVGSELSALRSDDAPQRRSQSEARQALADWLDCGPYAALKAEFAVYAQGAKLASQPLLARLFTTGNATARNLADDLTSHLARLLGQNPLAQVPLRHGHDDTTSTLQLYQSLGAVLALRAIDPIGLARRKPAQTVSFAASETHEHILAGELIGQLVEKTGERPGGAMLDIRHCRLRAGMVGLRHGERQALQVKATSGIAVSLKLQRRPLASGVAREYRLADGALVRQASASARESRLELAASLLGRMGRCDAAPLFAAMAEERGGDSLRWQALRECLGLDTALGFSALSAIAERPEDPLCTAASALRAQLIECYPQLAGAGACPA